jgi:hypothetical protein
MRIDKNHPEQRYMDFLDWLWTDGNIIRAITLVFAYMFHLLTTEEA